MATLKSDIINDCYSQMRISGLTVGASPGENQLALNRLETMMGDLSIRGICTDYNSENNPDVNSPTNTDRRFDHMMATNLAVRLIPDFNREVPPALHRQASQSLSTVSGYLAARSLRETPYPARQPIGSGNTQRWGNRRRFYTEDDRAPIECRTVVLLRDEVDDYEESYVNYLDELEDVDTYTIEADDGLKIVSDSLEDNVVKYRVEAVGGNSRYNDSLLRVRIEVETTSGRKEIRFRNFEIRDSRLETSYGV